jgi:hypothetical protein
MARKRTSRRYILRKPAKGREVAQALGFGGKVRVWLVR